MKTKPPHFPILLAAASAAAFSLSSCGPKEDPKPEPVAPAPAATPSGLDPKDRSSHFDAVSAHLDLGGEVYAYMDIDGDVKKLASLLDGLLDQVRNAPGANVPPQLATLDMEALAADLGLSNLAALGMSSYKIGDLYHSKFYLHVPGGRQGLLKIAGGDAAPFATRKLAPSGSDLIMEQDLDLKSAFDLIGSLALKYGGPQAAQEFAAASSQPIEDTGLTMATIFGHLDTKLCIVGQLHPDKPLPLPADVPVKMPGVDLLIAADDLGPVFAKLTSSIPAQQRDQLIKEGEGFVDLIIPVPPDAAQIFQPVIRHESASGRILFASSPAYLARCLAAESSAWDDPGFQAAMAGLPDTGNGLSFVSARFSEEFLRIYGDIFKMMASQGEMPSAMGDMLIGLMGELGLSPKHGQARVSTNLPDGILIAENSTASAKQTILSAGIAAVAIVFGSAAPVYQLQSAPPAETHTFDEAHDEAIPAFPPSPQPERAPSIDPPTFDLPGPTIEPSTAPR